MRAFICLEKPRSINSSKKADYFRESIKMAYRRAYPEEDAFWGDINLYGMVYYFHGQDTTLDADNMSKPVWDALRGTAFADDNAIKLRIAGIINNSLTGIDLSYLPDEVAQELLRVIGEAEHVLYIEFGPLTERMFRFGLSMSE